jgi:hypothetical protein
VAFCEISILVPHKQPPQSKQQHHHTYTNTLNQNTQPTNQSIWISEDSNSRAQPQVAVRATTVSKFPLWTLAAHQSALASTRQWHVAVACEMSSSSRHIFDFIATSRCSEHHCAVVMSNMFSGGEEPSSAKP